MKVQSKSTTVIAYQYNGSLSEMISVMTEVCDIQPLFDVESDTIWIVQARGNMLLRPGSWFVYSVGAGSNFWVVEDDVFQLRYVLKNAETHEYEKQSFVLDAFYLSDLNESTLVELQTFLGQVFTPALIVDIQSKREVPIVTLEGLEILAVGDYLIKGVMGEYYPVLRTDFDIYFEKM